ncbi:MAG: YgfZ/GcvT domain-containing protein [Propylenella sp.]
MPVAHLDDRAVVRIAGPDAATLLQSVLTLDVPSADRQGIGYGALLTPQGKVLWDFVLHKLPDGYAADVRAEEAEAFAKRLSLYKLRAAVEIGVAPELAVYAAWDDDPSPSPSPRGGGEAPVDPRLAELGRRRVAPKGSVATDASAADWHRHRIALAVPEGGIDFVFGDAFPFDAAMDSLHGVAFDKGCFVGQEVVSRMRHRGTARRRIVALHAKAALPAPGAEIVAGERPLGRLGSSADGNAIGLVRLDRLRAALDEGHVARVGAEEVAVELPSWATYGWPATATAGED